MDDIGFVEQLAVDEDLLVDDFQVIAGQTDDALHEMRMVLIRIFEDDDVAALEITVGKKFFVPMTTATEDKFVDEEMVADEEGFLHRRRRNLEGLDDEAGAEEGEDHGYEKRFKIFGKGGVVFVGRFRF